MPVSKAVQESVVISENAMTTWGEVSGEHLWLGLLFRETVALSGHDADIAVAQQCAC
jgi:hypothetical protein